MDDPWAKGTRGIEALALEPLIVAALQIAGGEIVDDRIAENVIQRVAGSDVEASLSDDHSEFDLVVELFHDVRLEGNLGIRPHHGCRRLGEELGMLRQLDLDTLGAVALGDVLHVVSADAEDVLRRPGNGRQKATAGRVDQRALRMASAIKGPLQDADGSVAIRDDRLHAGEKDAVGRRDDLPDVENAAVEPQPRLRRAL